MTGRWVVFTDLDETLLDRDTYDFADVIQVIDRLKERGIPVILVSSKTWAETQFYLKALETGESCIVENGGAVYVAEKNAGGVEDLDLPRVGHFFQKVFGVEMWRLKHFLNGFSNRQLLWYSSFFDWDANRIAQETGLTLEMAERAREREYDLPFVIRDEDLWKMKIMREEAVNSGLRLVRGGRFFHLLGNADKGQAVSFLKEVYVKQFGAIRTVGLGDAENDLSMLKEMDVPVLMRKKDGGYFDRIVRQLPRIRISSHPAPLGWSEMIERIFFSEGGEDV